MCTLLLNHYFLLLCERVCLNNIIVAASYHSKDQHAQAHEGLASLCFDSTVNLAPEDNFFYSSSLYWYVEYIPEKKKVYTPREETEYECCFRMHPA